MLVSSITKKSTLYRTLQSMGLLFTDDYYVRTNRALLHDTMSFQVPISNDDIYIPAESAVTLNINGESIQASGQMSFYGSIATIHKCEYKDYDRKAVEIWVGDEYINQSEITWVSTQVYDHAILPNRYDDYDPETGERTMATVRFYNGIFRRYSVKALRDGNYVHTATIDFTEPGANLVRNKYQCLFYYADGKLCVPTADMITRKTDNVYVFKIPYTRTLDAFWCWNLVGVHQADAGVTFNLHSPEDRVTYPRIFVDSSDDYPINTLFYPTVQVDKNCIIRVFDDGALEVPMPAVSRILLYPEYLDIEDPYNADNEHLNSLTPCDAFIQDTDNDDDILEKFRELAPFCYRIAEYFPRFSDEQSDFLMLDNSDWEYPYIEQTSIIRTDGTVENVLVFLAPYEGHRDVLFYDGWVYSDYEVVYLKDRVENVNGTPTYVIHDTTLDVDKLALLKFNTNEDTVINNIGDWIDKDRIVQLHYKLNKFYRNLLILKGSVLDGVDPGEAVRIGTVPPTVTDDERLWFEFLLNVEPMDFETNPVEKITMSGLNMRTIPSEIVKGAISIPLEPDAGPTDYKDIVMAYYNYEDRLQDHLILEMQEPEEQTEITYEGVEVGKLPDNPKPNDVVLEEQDYSGTSNNRISEYYTGDGEPVSSTYDAGDVYLNIPDEHSIFTAEDGSTIEMADIAELSTEEKINLVNGYITDGADAEIEEMRTLWNGYLESMDEADLNVLVYRVLMTDYFYNRYNDVGQITEEVVPKKDAIRHNLSFVMSEHEPTNLSPDTTWINVPVVTLQDYIYDLVCTPLYETAAYELPDGEYHKISENEERGTLVFDYMPHGTLEAEHELFREIRDDSLHTVSYGEEPESPEQNAIWYEFLDTVHNRICYSDESSMVLNLNERLVLLEFDHDNVTAFAFDDILMNFKGKLGIRYLSIVADLINSGVIDQSQVNIFYRRLITASDKVDLGLKRLYNGRSHVITTANIDTTDLGVLYSTNIGRFHIDYESDQITNLVREWAWRHVIDYRQMDVSFIPDRMILFVNGRLMPRSSYSDGLIFGDGVSIPVAGMLQLTDFDEVIDNVDIFYSVGDIELSKLKRIANEAWTGKIPDVRMLRHTDRDYGKFQPIIALNHTKRGFYDVLLEEYVLNGKLLRYIDYLKDHPEEYDDFRKEMLSAFHTISDKDFTDGEYDYYDKGFQNRIVIPGFGINQVYQIGANR